MAPLTNKPLPVLEFQTPQNYDHLNRAQFQHQQMPQTPFTQTSRQLDQQFIQQPTLKPISYHAPMYQLPNSYEFQDQLNVYTSPYVTYNIETPSPNVPNNSANRSLNNLIYQDLPKNPPDNLMVPQQQIRHPISPLNDPNSRTQMNFQLYGGPSNQQYLMTPIHKAQISESSISRAIEAAELSVAKEVGHITRKRRDRVIPSNSDSLYPCNLCDKVFNRPYNLKSHQKTHSDEKPFACNYCAKSFARSHDRKRHEKLHQGEKKFRCGGVLKDGLTRWGCNRRFARADALGRHFRTETGWNCISPLMAETKEGETPYFKDTLTNMELRKFLQDKSQLQQLQRI